MRKFKILPLLLLLLTMATSVAAQKKTQKTYIPWNNGKLVVSEEGRYLKHENGTPFFWLGETGWLLPERLNRDEAEYYLEQCKRRGYNVIQVQTLNNVPSMNIYGQYSMIDGYNFKNINQKGVYGYWDHMDYIIRTAAKKGNNLEFSHCILSFLVYFLVIFSYSIAAKMNEPTDFGSFSMIGSLI